MNGRNVWTASIKKKSVGVDISYQTMTELRSGYVSAIILLSIRRCDIACNFASCMRWNVKNNIIRMAYSYIVEEAPPDDVPSVKHDIRRAKIFLQKHSTESGDSLYAHHWISCDKSYTIAFPFMYFYFHYFTHLLYSQNLYRKNVVMQLWQKQYYCINFEIFFNII